MTEDCIECGEPTRLTVPALIGIWKRPGTVAMCQTCQDNFEHLANGDKHCPECYEWLKPNQDHKCDE